MKSRFFDEAQEIIELCAAYPSNQERIEKWLEWFYGKAWNVGFENGREDARTDRF